MGTSTETWRHFDTLSMWRLVDSISNSWKCEICQKTKNKILSYNPNRAITKLPCNHSFCFECLDTWLIQSTKCPLCGRTVQEIINID